MDDIDFLSALNEHLADTPLGFDAAPKISGDARSPHIWVVGLPRSGTTLAMQLLARHLNVGYVNNLMARFWCAPQTGAVLSRIVLKEMRPGSYSSSYGSTEDLAGPHEFSYFWKRLFGIQDDSDIRFSQLERETDWSKVQEVLTAIGSQFDGPMTYKAFYPAYFPEQFQSLFPNSLWIFISRPLLEVADSLTRAREAYYGERSKWLSMYAEGYQEYLKEPYWRQIALQIRDLSRIFLNEAPSKLPTDRVLHVSYGELCSDPRGFLERVIERAGALDLGSLDLRGALPESFAPAGVRSDSRTVSELRAGLAEVMGT